MSWHIIPLKFSSWSITRREKEPIKLEIFRFLSLLMKVYWIAHASFETTRSRFIQILYHCSVSRKITVYLKPLYFGQKEPMKLQDFRLLTAHIKFHQMCTLKVFFCWKYIKIFAKKVQRSYVSLPWTLMHNLKKNWSVVSKMTRIWWVLALMFDLKKYRGMIFHDTEGWFWRKTGRKTDLWFGKWHANWLVISKLTWEFD